MFLTLLLALGSVLASSSADAQPTASVVQIPDGSRIRAARVLAELQERECDKLLNDEVHRTCVDDALAAVYPLGFSIRPTGTQ